MERGKLEELKFPVVEINECYYTEFEMTYLLKIFTHSSRSKCEILGKLSIELGL